MYHVGMNLLQRGDTHLRRAERGVEFLAICRHGVALVPVGEAEIQHLLVDFSPPSRCVEPARPAVTVLNP